jgi:hypothetical protein
MKKILLVCLPMILLSWLSLSSFNPSNPPLGSTGAPGEGTCSDSGCHSGGSQTGTVSITGIPATVTPGQVYPIVLTSSSATAVRGGFQLLALSGSGANAGTVAAATGVNIGTIATFKYARQSAVKSYSGGSVSWTFNWTAPASLTNNSITFYYSSLLGNGNGVESGDATILGSKSTVLTPAVAPVTANTTQTNVTCNGGTNGTATVSPSGGNGSFSYLWSNSQSTATATNLSAGAYTCTVTSGSSSTTVNVTITQPTAIIGNVTTGTISCTQSIAICSVSASGGSGSYTYQWTNGQTGTTASYNLSGPGSTTITDNNGCSIVKNFVITSTINPPSVTVNAGAISCTQSTASVSAIATGGSGVYTSYQWSNGTTGQTTTFNNSGLAVVTVTDNAGCSKIQNFTIQNNVVSPSATFSTGTITCAQNTATVSASPSGGSTPYSILWSNGTSGLSTTYNSAGNYSATVTDGNGCSSVKQFTISSNTIAPTAPTIATPPLFCVGTGIILSATAISGANYSYNWSAANGGTILSGATTLAPNVLGAGTYSFVVTNNTNGCTSVATTTVQQGASQALTMSGNGINCFTPNANLSAIANSAGNTFSWKGPANFTSASANPSVSTAGIYTVTVTKSGTCPSIGTINITEDKALPTATANTSNISCNTPNATLSAAGGGTYAWSGINFTSNKKDTITLAAGIYTVTVTGLNGCKNSASVTVTQNTTPPNISASSGQLTCANPNATLTGSSTTPNVTYLWTGPNNFSSTKKDTSSSVAGTYTLKVKNTLNGCESQQAVTILQNSQLPQVSTQNDTITCKKTTATILASSTTAGATFAWKGPNNTTFSGQQIPNAGVGTYQLTVTATNGCTVVSSASVIENKVFPTVDVLPKTVKICDGKTATFISNVTCTCNAALAWKNQAGAIIGTNATYTQASTFAQKIFFEATNPKSGCVSKDSVSFTVVSLPSASVTTKTKDCTVVCATAQIIGGQAPYSFKYSSGDVQGCNITAGANSVSVTDANGCTSTSNFTVTTAVPLTATIGKITNAVKGQTNGSATVAITGGTTPLTFDWANSSGKTVATTQNLTNIGAGIYTCNVTDNNGCKTTVAVTIGETVSTQNIDLERFIQIYPNPANDILTLKININSSNVRLTMMSMDGREVLRQTLENNNTIEVGQFARGIYLLKINIGNEAVYKRVILN